MSAPHGRDRTGRFAAGASGNPAGRPRAAASFTARAKELSLDVLENMAKIATTGRGPAAVQAGALVLAYGEGKPVERIDLTARRGGPDAIGGQPDAARQRLEAMIIEAQASGTDTRSVVLSEKAQQLPQLVDVGEDACPTVAPGAEPENTR